MHIMRQLLTEYDWEDITEEQLREDLSQHFEDADAAIEQFKATCLIETPEAEYMLAPDFVKV